MWWLISVGSIIVSSVSYYLYNNPNTLYKVCENSIERYLSLKNKLIPQKGPLHENKLIIKDLKIVVPFFNFIQNIDISEFDSICASTWPELGKKYVYHNSLYKSVFSLYVNHLILHMVYSYNDIDYRISINHTTPLSLLKSIVDINNLAFTFINEPEAIYTNIPKYQLNNECINVANEELKNLMISYAGPKNDYYTSLSITQDYKGFLNHQMTDPIFNVSLSKNGQSFHMNDNFIKIIDIFGNEYNYNSGAILS